jgi:hypothetical protein
VTEADQDAARVPLAAWAGFIAGPICWFGQQLLVFALAQTGCGGSLHRPALLAIWAVLSLALAAAGVVSWRAGRRAVSADGDPTGFVGFLGVTASLLFLVAMAWQAAASLVYSGCER